MWRWRDVLVQMRAMVAHQVAVRASRRVMRLLSVVESVIVGA